MLVVPPPSPDIRPLLTKRDNVAALPGPDAALAELLEILGLEILFALPVVDPSLWIWQVGPGKDGAKGGHRAKEEENQALAAVALVRLVDAVYNQ